MVKRCYRIAKHAGWKDLRYFIHIQTTINHRGSCKKHAAIPAVYGKLLADSQGCCSAAAKGFFFPFQRKSIHLTFVLMNSASR